MKKREFKKPFGQLIENNDGHLTFLPDKLPPKINYAEGLVSLISEASIQLGNLSGIGKLMPNPHLLISPYLKQEAVLSSKIEGTQASILDVFRYEARGGSEEKEDELKRVLEVVNYVAALNDCLQHVKNGKQIDVDMIKNAHRILMRDVRGQKLQPGEFRNVQNWIGLEGTKIEDATYVPPPSQDVAHLMDDLVKFIQEPPGRIPVLVQCAMVHYLFEAIHPFSDGNGRIGRLLIPVLLAQRKLLEQPLLYLSAYVEKQKVQYYALLQDISENSAWIEWLRFFLIGVISQSNEAVNNIQELMNLKKSYDMKLNSEKASGSTTRLVDFLFSNPVITVRRAADYLGITYPAAKDVITSLKEMNILADHTDRPRGRTYVAREILSVIMKTR
jgi:Fic family protein